MSHFTILFCRLCGRFKEVSETKFIAVEDSGQDPDRSFV